MLPTTKRNIFIIVIIFALFGLYNSFLTVSKEDSKPCTNTNPPQDTKTKNTKEIQEIQYSTEIKENKEIKGKIENKEKEDTRKLYANIAEAVEFPEHYTHDDPSLCVIIRTYNKQRSSLPALIAALGSNDYRNLKLFLVDTMGDFYDLSLFAELYNLIFGRDFVYISNITPEYARKRYPLFTTPDYGYLQTDLMMEQLSSANNIHHCNYFLVTNGDNLYSRSLIYLTLEYMRANLDLIGFHFVSHYCYEESVSWRPRPGCYSQHYTEFVFQRIDLGAALIRKERLLEKNASFIISDLNNDPTGSMIQVPFCDGYFYEKFSEGSSSIVLNATLLVHQ